MNNAFQNAFQLPRQLATIAAGLTINVLQTVALMGMMTVPQLERGWEACFEGNLQGEWKACHPLGNAVDQEDAQRCAC